VDTASEVINSVAETGILIGFANTKVGREEWSRCVFWVGWMWHVVGKRSRWNDIPLGLGRGWTSSFLLMS